jgi:hypothetical protein
LNRYVLIVENTDSDNAVIFVKDGRRKCNIANSHLQVENTTVLDRIFFQIFLRCLLAFASRRYQIKYFVGIQQDGRLMAGLYWAVVRGCGGVQVLRNHSFLDCFRTMFALWKPNRAWDVHTSLRLLLRILLCTLWLNERVQWALLCTVHTTDKWTVIWSSCRVYVLSCHTLLCLILNFLIRFISANLCS